MMASVIGIVFDALVDASIAGAVVALGIWAVVAVIGRLPAAVRCALWWLVALKLLTGLIAMEPVALKVLPPASPVSTAIYATAGSTAVSQALAAPIDSTPLWGTALVALWLCGLVAAAALAIAQWRRLGSLRARSRQAGADVTALVGRLSARAGVSSAPGVRFSDETEAPMVTGVLRPTIILPARRWACLSASQQEMAICHEVMHVGRGDLWLGLVPLLAERIFFFHPLAHLAAREYVVAREAACDAAVLRVLEAEPRDYGRLLVTLGVAPLPGGLAASGAAHSFSSLKRRIGMLDHGSPSLAVRLAGWGVAAFAVVALVPLTLAERSSAAEATPVALDQPAASPQKSEPVQEVVVQRREGARLDYTLVLGGKHGTISSGDFDDRRLELRHDGNERVLWFRRNGKAYEVRDSAAIEQAAAIVQPMAEIGRQQGEIGAKQGAIGAQQGVMGARQGEVGARQGAVGARQGELGARQGTLGAREAQELTKAERELIEQEHAKIDREMEELNAKMAALDKEMSAVATSMPDLSGEMNELSKQMNVLSRKMTEASAKADAEMQALVDKLIKLGTAKPIN
jgi:beta-lactamase regulating signal transducer with metallopeptidase domain